MTKQIIGRGCESEDDEAVLRPVSCSRVTTPFETHRRWGHSSLPLLKSYVHNFQVCCH